MTDAAHISFVKIKMFFEDLIAKLVVFCPTSLAEICQMTRKNEQLIAKITIQYTLIHVPLLNELLIKLHVVNYQKSLETNIFILVDKKDHVIGGYQSIF